MQTEIIVHYLLHGMVAPTPLFLVVYFFATAGMTLLSISCYLHRSQTHRTVYFVPVLSHFFRLVLWLFTGTVVKEWVAVHRKHHATCDTEEDPHSPRHLGIRTILLNGADIYQSVAKNNPELLREYGEGTPDDWFEHTLFGKSNLGIAIALIVQLVLFGTPALIIWSLQMLVMPVVAAGFINGIAHVLGYQTYKDGDITKEGRTLAHIGDARNVPTYIIAVGEEFHNNHHAYQDRYKFSHQWYEFDLAGTFIELLTWIGFAWVPRRK